MDAYKTSLLHAKVALVTGAASGIGEAIAKLLGAFGAAVAVTDLDTVAATRVADGIPGARPYRLDVRSAAEAESTVSEIEHSIGPIDILCNNAGVSTMNQLWKISEDEWDLNFDVNVKGVFLLTKAVAPGMIERRSGVIVNTASMAGKKGVSLLSHYAASKWACIGFTKSAAAELGPYGIRVNCVCPGYVATSMQERELEWEASLRNMTVEDVLQEYVSQTPLGRIETPMDVARAVLYLASPASEFLTGAAIDVTGGAHLH